MNAINQATLGDITIVAVGSKVKSKAVEKEFGLEFTVKSAEWEKFILDRCHATAYKNSVEQTKENWFLTGAIFTKEKIVSDFKLSTSEKTTVPIKNGNSVIVGKATYSWVPEKTVAGYWQVKIS